MLGQYYYHEIIRKTVISFGTLFNDIHVRHQDSTGKDISDIKVPIGNGLMLDLTYNPDFSQAEVDDEIVNLRRFEIKLPEKRQFFLQNSDIFSNYGAVRTIAPFFTRRIGLARDPNGNLIEIANQN